MLSGQLCGMMTKRARWHDPETSLPKTPADALAGGSRAGLLLGVLYRYVLALRCSRMLVSIPFGCDLTIVGTSVYNFFACHTGTFLLVRAGEVVVVPLALQAARPVGASSSPVGDKNLPELLSLTLGLLRAYSEVTRSEFQTYKPQVLRQRPPLARWLWRLCSPFRLCSSHSAQSKR
jgi:hypothetical protein